MVWNEDTAWVKVHTKPNSQNMAKDGGNNVWGKTNSTSTEYKSSHWALPSSFQDAVKSIDLTNDSIQA